MRKRIMVPEISSKDVKCRVLCGPWHEIGERVMERMSKMFAEKQRILFRCDKNRVLVQNGYACEYMKNDNGKRYSYVPRFFGKGFLFDV